MKKAMLRMHYGIWIFMALVCVVTGMLFRGQQDIMKSKAKSEGQMSIIKDLSLVELEKIRI